MGHSCILTLDVRYNVIKLSSNLAVRNSSCRTYTLNGSGLAVHLWIIFLVISDVLLQRERSMLSIEIDVEETLSSFEYFSISLVTS